MTADLGLGVLPFQLVEQPQQGQLLLFRAGVGIVAAAVPTAYVADVHPRAVGIALCAGRRVQIRLVFQTFRD